MIEPGDIVRVAALVTSAFETLGVPYLVGGSLASSIHGIPRATQDVDLVAELDASHVGPLVAALEGIFYVDDHMVREAVARRGSFNVIHLATMLKVDVFVAKDEPHAREQMRRRQRHDIDESTALEVASAEDVVLHKLTWFELGNRVSDRQWRDLLGVLEVQGERLDLGYLRTWAAALGVGELLEHALREADPAGEAPF